MGCSSCRLNNKNNDLSCYSPDSPISPPDETALQEFLQVQDPATPLLSLPSPPSPLSPVLNGRPKNPKNTSPRPRIHVRDPRTHEK